MVTMAKAMSAAYLPISALMVSEPIWQAMVSESQKIGVFGHGYTYSAHPAAAAVALETLKIYDERDILAHVRRMAPRLQQGLRRFVNHPLVGEVQGMGLVGALQLVKSKKPKRFFEATQPVAPFMAKRAQEHGLIVRALFENRIAVCPPLIINEAQIEELLRRFGLALDDTWAMVQEKGLAAA
jgi:4-aminobutyrate--pyruvate transaminase